MNVDMDRRVGEKFSCPFSTKILKKKTLDDVGI